MSSLKKKPIDKEKQQPPYVMTRKLGITITVMLFFLSFLISFKKIEDLFTDPKKILIMAMAAYLGYMIAQISGEKIKRHGKKYLLGISGALLLVCDSILLFQGDATPEILKIAPFVTIFIFGASLPSIRKEKKHTRRSLLAPAVMVALVTVLTGVGLLLRIYKISDIPFQNDERFELETAIGYAKTGEFLQWDLQYDQPITSTDPEYNRAWPYTWQIAQVLKKVPATEGTARSISLIWGILTIPLLMLFTYYLSKKISVTVGVGIVAVWNPLLIWASTTVREYSMHVFGSILFLFLCEVIQKKYHSGSEKWTKKIPFYLLTGIPLIATAALFYNTHKTFLILLAYAVLSVGWEVVCSIQKKYHIPKKIVLPVAALIAAIFIFIANRRFPIGFTLQKANLEYFWYSFQYFRLPTWALGGAILGGAILWKKSRWLVGAIVFSVVMMIFVADRYAAEKYGLFFLPALWIIIIIGLNTFAETLVGQKRAGWRVLIFFAVLFIAGPFLSIPGKPASSGITQTFNTDTRLKQSNDFRKTYAYVAKKITADETAYIRTKHTYYLVGINLVSQDFPKTLDDLKQLIARGDSWFVYPKDRGRVIPGDLKKHLEEICVRHNTISRKTNMEVFHCKIGE